ncbi:hypothetical protein BH18CHL2_BH18CHL2_09060 [soil metagenome]
MAIIKPRTVVRGRTDDPVDRLETSAGGESQPARFTHGMWAIILFVSSEAMFFAALFTTYFYLRTRLPEWEPIFGEKPGADGLPLINTIVLVASSFTMQMGVWAIRKGDRRRLIMWLAITVLMGAFFLAGQGYEYTQLGFLPADGIFAATFFTLTGFHGLHVLGGVTFIALCLLRALRGQFTANRHLAVEAASIYWHFVDVVWIGLFTTIYIVG